VYKGAKELQVYQG